jgi:ribosomal protein S27E
MTGKFVDTKCPDCFGQLDIVFPKSKNGLRNTPKTCLPCSHKTQCIRSAMEGAGGLKVREEMLDRAYSAGTISFFERWSKMKQIKQQRKKKSTATGPEI